MALGVVVIGAGYFSRFHLEGWASNPDASVVALCDPDAARCEAMAAEFGIAQTFADAAEMLAACKPDLVDIVTPPPTHLALVELTARHGINTICQKPLAPDWETARRIADVADKAGITLVVHENFRFSPWYRSMPTCAGSTRSLPGKTPATSCLTSKAAQPGCLTATA